MRFKQSTRKQIRERAEQQRIEDFYAAKRESDKHKSPVTDPAVLEHVRKQVGQCRGNQCSENSLDCL